MSPPSQERCRAAGLDDRRKEPVLHVAELGARPGTSGVRTIAAVVYAQESSIGGPHFDLSIGILPLQPLIHHQWLGLL